MKVKPSVPDTKSLLPPMNPVPGRPVLSFPTPIIADGIVTEFVAAEVGSYTPVVYGTRYDALHHGAFPKQYADFELVYQEPADANGYFYRRIFCNPRIDQTEYNAQSIEYEFQNPNYPIITRLFVVKRSEFTPLPPLTPDFVIHNALLVQEKLLNQTTPQEINSLYVTVARVYRVLPGPIATTYDFDSTVNNMVRTDRQLVLSTDIFNPASVSLLLQAQETAEDSSYYKLRAISYFESLPPTRVEYRTGRYPFPTLVTDITTTTVSLSTTPDRSFVEWYPSMRDDPNAAAIYRLTTEFFASEPTPDTIYVFSTQNLVYKGISFSVSIGGVLNDEITMSASFSGDPNYGDLSESITFPATSPTATEYLALIGNYVTTGSDITQWRGNIFTKQKTELLVI